MSLLTVLRNDAKRLGKAEFLRRSSELDMMEVQMIPGKGRGTIATEAIAQGTVIEIAAVGAFPAEQRETIDQTAIFEYYFVRPPEYGQGKYVPGYVVFGMSSLSNHTEHPNARVEWVEDEVGLWAHLVAIKDIARGEEVTVFYTNIDEYDTSEFV